MSALASALVVFLSVYFASRQLDAIDVAMRDKAETYSRLVSKQVESGVAFDDRETVREIFAATAEDRDVSGLALFDAHGRPIFSLGDFRGGPPPAGPVDRLEIRVGTTFVRAAAPVIAREGPRGTLLLEISRARLDAERRSIEVTAGVVGVGALALGVLAAWAIARSLGRRLEAIACAVGAVAGGDLSVGRLDDDSADEVGELARGFNAMSASLRDLLERVRETGAREAERLDALVRARTDELHSRNRDMRLVLDNVGQGLLLLDRAGRAAAEQSAVVERWFGTTDPGAPFWELLASLDPRAALDFELNWAQLTEGALPVDLLVDQLPRTIRADAAEYELVYTPVMEGETVERILVVISDVTERRLAERTQAEQYDIVQSFERMTRDRTGFLEFASDARAMVDGLCAPLARPGVSEVRRWLHTLKGNALLFGLAKLASLCHELEDVIAESGEDLPEASRERLRAHWDAYAARIAPLLGAQGRATVALSEGDYEAFLSALVAGRPRRELARIAAEWRLEAASDRLARYATHARALLKRMEGVEAAVSVECGRVRLSSEAMRPFWAVFGHAVRNAVAHGLEPVWERVATGKREAGSLVLRAAREGSSVIVEVADDGRGIDWEKVRARACAAGLPCEAPADLLAALFQEGLSTHDYADDLAGRGVGMGALRTECERLGGRVFVTSRRGEGTSLQFVFPADAVAENDELRRARSALRTGAIREEPTVMATSA